MKNNEFVEEVRWSSQARVILTSGFLLTMALVLGSTVLTPPRAREMGTRFISGAIVSVVYGGVMLIFGTLRISIDDEALTVGFGPFRERVSIQSIASCTGTTYRWIDWGGWGIRRRRGGKMYNVPGDGGKAIQLGLDNGRRLFFSSSDPAAVCNALQARRSGIGGT